MPSSDARGLWYGPLANVHTGQEFRIHREPVGGRQILQPVRDGVGKVFCPFFLIPLSFKISYVLLVSPFKCDDSGNDVVGNIFFIGPVPRKAFGR